jgi:hypothetical protein
VVPYTEARVFPDWAPYNYLDGYYNDTTTGGSTQERAILVAEGSNEVLDVLLPKNCLKAECAMQVKSGFFAGVEEATLKFKCAAPCRQACAGAEHSLDAAAVLKPCIAVARS